MAHRADAPEQLTRDGQPLLTRGATIRGGASYNPETRTVPVSLGTGAPVLRYDWNTDRNYTEVLSMDPAHVRLQRMNGGAPFLTDHRAYSTEAVVGRFVKGNVRIEGGELVGDVRLSRAKRHEDTVGDIVDGILCDTSVGYKVYRWEITKDEISGAETRTAVDWEPVEGSVVPVPADTTGGIRSASDTVDNRGTPGGSADNHTEDHDMIDEEKAALRAEGVAQEKARAEAEEGRKTGIRALMSKAGLDESDVRSMLDDDKVSVDQAATRMWDIRAAKDGKDPNRSQQITIVRDAGDTQFRAIAAAVESRAVQTALPDFAQHLRGKSIADLARENLRVKGFRADGLSPIDAFVQACRAVAGHTTGDFSSVFANVGYKSLNAMYQIADEYSWWKDIGRREDFTTLYPRYVVKMTGMGVLPSVNEGANYQGVTQYDAHETIDPLPKTGGELRITFEMVERDDLSAFQRAAAEFGKTARVTEATKALAAIQANMSDGHAVCSTEHTNYVGSGGAPDLDRIAALDALLRNATDGNGHVIGSGGKVLLLPVASRTVVEQLYSDKLFASDPTDCPTVPLLPANRRAVPGLTTKYFLCTANQLALEYGWYEGGPTVTQYPEWKSDSLIWHCRDIFGIGVIRHQDFACDSGTGA